VFDTRNGQRVAALVRLHSLNGKDKADSSGTHILEIPYLKNLRDHLGETLPTYMLPTALRILQTGEDIPRTPSLKVIRAEAVSQYFPLSKSFENPSDVELFNFAYPRDESLRKAWDSAGMV
jgi:acyl-CoA synthetase (AMP-forming)/AMP-acid ligase II